MYKNVIVIVINYISNVIDFYNYFIITCQLLQTFKNLKKFILFLPCLLLNNKFRLSQYSIGSFHANSPNGPHLCVLDFVHITPNGATHVLST